MSSSGLEDALAKARDALASGLVVSEAAVQASVVRPILRELGWDDADPRQWQMEYPVDNGRVDEALIGPLGKPLVFVEVKRPGVLSPKAEDQLFRYANNKGVPLLVLTDGDTWDLYLSMAEGEPVERRFTRCKLTESSEFCGVARDLRTFLERSEVLSGAARKAAEARLEQVKHREIGKGGLDSAWEELLRGPDEILRDLLIERVEENVGSRPGTRDAEEFLRMLAAIVPVTAQQGDVAKWLQAAPANLTSGMKATVTRWLKQSAGHTPGKPSPDGAPPKPTPGSGKLSGIRIRGREHEVLEFVRVHLLLASELESWNGGLLNELAARAKPGMKNPRAVRASDPVLQTDRSKYYRQIPQYPEWYLHVHWSAKDHQRLMREMTELAGLSWGSDVVVLFAADIA
ncbi:hypothetical protein [Candidatus Poriferisodalis sp.]|uniref:hypothetical protein n=1 Tax=Candidatus Poriferisodalis sp. TaxID=3101277 RepID=UPI003B018066